jgi:hypothetical protein
VNERAVVPSATTGAIILRTRDEIGEWNRVVHQMVVDPYDPSPVERMASKNAREHKAIFLTKISVKLLLHCAFMRQ